MAGAGRRMVRVDRRYNQPFRLTAYGWRVVIKWTLLLAVGCDPASKIFYARKRREGKSHHQAVLALVRRRANVLHAILRTRLPYDPKLSRAAS